MTYYVVELQTRADGQVNSTITARSSLALGQSLYYERLSKMVATDLYPHVGLLLIDQNAQYVAQSDFDTLYTEESK